jgi:hypothetical protein
MAIAFEHFPAAYRWGFPQSIAIAGGQANVFWYLQNQAGGMHRPSRDGGSHKMDGFCFSR